MEKIGLSGVQSVKALANRSDVQKTGVDGFGEILKDSLSSVNKASQESAALQEGLISGEHSNIHETMIAMEKSSISFRMLTKVQTKVIDAYKEIMRLQL